MIDLNRVQEYINLGWDKDEALKMVKEETSEQPPEPINDPKPDLSGYVSKEEMEQEIKKAIEEERRKATNVDPVPDDEPKDIKDIMAKFF